MKLPHVFAALLASFPHTSVSADCDSLQSISWLLGHWEMKTDKGFQREQWQRISEGTFEGSGTSLNEQKHVTFSEALRLVEMKHQVFYLAKIDDNPLPVAFAATHCDETSVMFENPDHDFPQRLNYTLEGNHLSVDVRDLQGKGFTLDYVKQ